ncbi:MAG: NAD(P)/FAD-dependent oxidoreductase [Deltaproteobacteria bacterium]|jgi:cyclohexanone monooxygenase|nr:NAD(P)/FAD-dependent oxidoreductase [Deltaproteobacteria bacterium]
MRAQKGEGGRDFDVLVVGAGLAGLYALHRLRGLGLSVRVLEAGDGVGGTWFWNRYPGARCDIESMEYSYQFSEELQQEWEWTERFASQSEILDYINHVAERFDLRRDIQLETRVEEARFDERENRWTLRTDGGEELSARFCVMATGCLSHRNTPEFEGLSSFRGERFHTGNWPREKIDFGGKRVGVIGTGSSGVQLTPLVAQEAEHLYVFQRTPNFSVPAHNRPLEPEEQRRIKAEYAAFRRRNYESFFGTQVDILSQAPESAMDLSPEERMRHFEAAWARGGPGFLNTFDDLLINRASNDAAVEFNYRKIREIVEDPQVAEKLLPKQTFGCKRICVDTNYFEIFNRANVTLVDVSENAIGKITPEGLELANGEAFALDMVVFATGFDAMTGALLAIDPVGVSGLTLHEKWAEGPRTYLGLGVNGFPNLFTITGPGSPSVLSNMVPAIEQHVNWIADCIGYLEEKGFTRIEARADAEEAWRVHVNELADTTLYPSCHSWYVGTNIPGKPRVFMPYLGFHPYVQKCDEVAMKAYEGFELRR